MAESLICELEKFSLWADQSAKDAYKTVTIKKKKKVTQGRQEKEKRKGRPPVKNSEFIISFKPLVGFVLGIKGVGLVWLFEHRRR